MKTEKNFHLIFNKKVFFKLPIEDFFVPKNVSCRSYFQFKLMVILQYGYFLNQFMSLKKGLN